MTATPSATITLRDIRALEESGQFAEADAAYRALAGTPQPDPAILLGWANLRRRGGDLKSAIELAQAAHQQSAGQARPGQAAHAQSALILAAGIHLDAGQADPAAQALRAAAQLGPRTPAMDFEGARLSELTGQHVTAATLYRGVVRADPRHAEARLGLARLLFRAGQAEEARAAYEALLKREPTHRIALAELAYLHGNQRRFRDALALYDRLTALGADPAMEVSQAVLGLMHVCDWADRPAQEARLRARAEAEVPAVVECYAWLAAIDDAALHRRMAGNYAAALAAVSANRARPAPRAVSTDRRLRVGYVSADFNQHATSLLLAPVLEAHDRSRFKFIAYDHSQDDGSATRARVMGAFERFVVLGAAGPVADAARIADDGVDILIDLKGYTDNARSEIFALRPAPIQVSFLGYVGTQGAPWIDYVLADEIVLPPEQTAHWVEQPVWLPHSYYPNGRDRPAPAEAPTRAALGLPEDGVVFACFNNPYKITPAIFATWMEILRATPGSALWLFEGNEFMAANLRREAAAAGIDPTRLHFAGPQGLDIHLARHAQVDLFLDTAPYGAHTTGADALWCGVPLLTCPGETWASRVGASLLRAVNLPELVAPTTDAYRDMAIALARDPGRRAALRAHLLAARDTAPLFDAPAFARALEAAYDAMAARAREGLPPAPIRIS